MGNAVVETLCLYLSKGGLWGDPYKKSPNWTLKILKNYLKNARKKKGRVVWRMHGSLYSRISPKHSIRQLGLVLLLVTAQVNYVTANY